MGQLKNGHNCYQRNRYVTQLEHCKGGLQAFRREDGKEGRGCWTLLRKGQRVETCL